MNKQIARIEKPIKKELFSKKTLKKFPQDIQDAIKTPEEKRTARAEIAGGAGLTGPAAPTTMRPATKPAASQSKRRGRAGAQGPGRPDRRAEETNAAEAAGRHGRCADGDFRFTPHPPFQPGTWRITYEDFGFKGKFLPRRRRSLRAASDVFRSTGLGSFADEMKAPVIEPGFLTVLT